MYVFVFLFILILLLQYKEPFSTKEIATVSAVEMIMDNPVVEGLHKRIHYYIPFKKQIYSWRRYFRRR